MEYLEAKATTTSTTDLGEFKALVATYDRDREGDVIQPGAFAHSISEWRDVGRLVPLHWNHHADQIVGDVDPQEMWETDDGLEVSGRIDLDTEQGRKVWRSLKANRLGFSFGYLATRSRKRSDGGRDLMELDVYEVSATPSPMNNRTRVLTTKSVEDEGTILIQTKDGGFERVPVSEPFWWEIEEEAAREAKAMRPIQVATFKC